MWMYFGWVAQPAGSIAFSIVEMHGTSFLQLAMPFSTWLLSDCQDIPSVLPLTRSRTENQSLPSCILSHQPPSPSFSPTPTTPPLYLSSSPSKTSKTESEPSSDHQKIADWILLEATQTEGGCILIPNIDLPLYEHITTLVSERAPGHLCYYYNVHKSSIIVDRLESSNPWISINDSG